MFDLERTDTLRYFLVAKLLTFMETAHKLLMYKCKFYIEITKLHNFGVFTEKPSNINKTPGACEWYHEKTS